MLLNKIVSLAQRKVVTQAGVDKYGAPIGSVIGDSPNSGPAKSSRPITIVRLRSLQRQMDVARRTGQKGLYSQIRGEFLQEVKQFAVGKSAAEVLDALKAK